MIELYLLDMTVVFCLADYIGMSTTRQSMQLMNKLAGMTLTSSSPQLSVAQPVEVFISELHTSIPSPSKDDSVLSAESDSGFSLADDSGTSAVR